ncbi:hypothetical protein ASF20_13425 [Methylobacterium sp. Leaf88]|nr:hypothetical protein ASF20_13425 [Methylobacterium sp. Leaf88]
MVDQKLLDELADGLVAAGVQVTYPTLEGAFRERSRLTAGRPAGHSRRDLQGPFDDWKRRRRYRPHLAALDLDEGTERALARFLALARSDKPIDARLADDDETATRSQVNFLAGRIEETVAALAAENAALRADIAALASTVATLVKGRPEGRKSGIVASTSLHFWDQLMREFAARIRKRGPLTAEELDATITDDTREFAMRNFERITPGVIAGKLTVRNEHNKYITPLGDGRFDLIERGRTSKRQASGNATGPAR